MCGMDENLNKDLSVELHSQLAGILSRSPNSEDVILALAQIGLSDAIAILMNHQKAIRKTYSTECLRRVIDAILDQGESHKGKVIWKDLTGLISLYNDVASPDKTAAFLWSLAPATRGDAVREIVMKTLKRAPRNQRLLRIASEFARNANDIEAAHQLLTALGETDASPATINYVYRTRVTIPPLKGKVVRAAFLSSFTIDGLVPYVDLEFRKLGLVPEMYVAPFNSWAQQMIDGSSQLYSFAPEIAFLAVAIDDLIPELAGNPPISVINEKSRGVIDHIVNAVERFIEVSNAIIVVHNFHSCYRSPLGVSEGRTGQTRFSWLNEVNMRLAEKLHTLERAFVLDMNELLLYRGGGSIENPKMRYLARMVLGEQILNEIASAYARYVAPLKGLRRKCIVLDLDNTLWGGVVGEDGIHGIKLGDVSPGIEYRDFQRYLLSLSEQGFLLAINSKNNPEDALAVIRSHESMILREEAFSSVRINWRSKAENIVSIVEELNIGLDAMVFLDDNPNERELMRQTLPKVLTPELPQDPSLYRSVIERLPQLHSLTVTEEDKTRVQLYRTKRQREEVRVKTQSVEEYLHSLEICVRISLARAETLPRIHQLFERTNQFNLTTKRYSLSQLSSIAADDRWRLYALRAQDRFGDHGLVAAALVCLGPDRWVLDSFLMSCRVIGYGVETAFLSMIIAEAKKAAIRILVGEYVATEKNIPAGDFYSKHGFTREVSEEGVVVWTMCLSESQATCPGWIRMEIKDAT